MSIPPDDTHAQRTEPDVAGASELVPDQASDDRGMVEAYPDDWYEQERPPHHG